MQATNYCRSLAMQLHEQLRLPLGAEIHADTRRMLAHIDATQKFLLPGGGMFLDSDSLRALDPEVPLNLPFQHCALEFQPIGSANQIIIFISQFDETLAVSGAVRAHKDDRWDETGRVWMQRVGGFVLNEDGTTKTRRWRAEEGVQRRFAEDISGIVLGFCNALSCSNVRPELHTKPASKKVKAALPFDAYYVLTVDLPQRGRTATGQTHGDRRSPREHVRRGHIRRIESGAKVWVNATIVSPHGGEGGKVRKEYAPRPGPAS